MADFTQTITNTIQVIGAEPPNVWGTVLWGQNWGYGDNDLPVNIGKLISESLTLTDAITFGFYVTVSNSLSLAGDMYGEYLIDMNGWYLDFGTSNAESRPFTDYSDPSDVTTSYTTATDITTSWSRQ